LITKANVETNIQNQLLQEFTESNPLTSHAASLEKNTLDALYETEEGLTVLGVNSQDLAPNLEVS
jgi:hypothetical protein